MQRIAVIAALDAIAQAGVAEQFGNFGQDFKVLLGCSFGHQQENQQLNRLLVRRIKANGLQELEYGSHGRFQALDAAMRNRHAVTEPGRTQAFTCKKTISDQRT